VCRALISERSFYQLARSLSSGMKQFKKPGRTGEENARPASSLAEKELTRHIPAEALAGKGLTLQPAPCTGRSKLGVS